MRGTTELKVIERPSSLDVSSGKHKVLYGKIISTLDIMGSTKCIELAPSEVIGKTLKIKVLNLRAGLNRTLKTLNKDYTPAVSYNEDKDVIYVWSRVRVK